MTGRDSFDVEEAMALYRRMALARAQEAPLSKPPRAYPDSNVGATPGLACTYETRTWSGDIADGEPYYPATPARLGDPAVLSHLVVKSRAFATSRKALASLERVSARLAPSEPSHDCTDLLHLIEALHSSHIEGIYASPTQVAQVALGARYRSPDPVLVAANHAAQRDWLTSLAPGSMDDAASTESAALAAHATLLDSQPGYRRPGAYRTETSWISGYSPPSAAFVPPRPETVGEAMADLYAFIARTDLDPFVHAVAAHAQFETIHPHGDGNGRTGRMLFAAMLVAHGLLPTGVSIPVSAGIRYGRGSKQAYYEALGEYRRGALSPLVEVFARAVVEAAQIAEYATVHQGEQREDLDDALARVEPRDLSPTATRLVTGPILDRAAWSARSAAQVLGVSSSAASGALDQLHAAGLLDLAPRRSRTRVYRVFGALGVLNENAPRDNHGLLYEAFEPRD